MICPRQYEQPFAGLPEQVSQARHFVRDALADLPAEVVDAAVLVASELAGNAVRHTRSGLEGGKFVLRLQVTHGQVHVEVVDQGSERTRPDVQLGGDEGGRGLWVAGQLGELRCALAPPVDGGGHRVWVTLALPPQRRCPQPTSYPEL